MDKIEKIRQEIERQMKFYDEKEMKAWDDSEQGDEDALWYQGHRKMCAKLLSFLDTLSEEPDKSLEEAAKEYAEGPECTWVGTTALEEAFKAGAKWQAEKDKETIKLAEDHAYFAGREKMREELMEWTKEHQEGERQGSYTWSCYQIILDILNSM